MCGGFSTASASSRGEEMRTAPQTVMALLALIAACESPRPVENIDTMTRDGIQRGVDGVRVKAECLQRYRKQAVVDPLDRLVPATSGGALIGYRVFPGSDPLFEALGLRAGDILTKVNEVSLAQGASDIMDLAERLLESDQLSMTFLRNGEPKTLTVRIERGASECSFLTPRK